MPADAKVNGIMCRPKPNGTVRVILNLSAPARMSVNDGIDSDDFPTSMSSTSKWVECLNMAGRGALMTKIDWSDAYKHLHVRPEDQAALEMTLKRLSRQEQMARYWVFAMTQLVGLGKFHLTSCRV